MELWDLYTKDREKTGKTMIRGAKMPADLYHLVVHVCIFNSSGEMLVGPACGMSQPAVVP